MAQETSSAHKTVVLPIGLAEAQQLRLQLCAAYAAVHVFVHWLTHFIESSALRTTPWNPEAGLTVVAGALFGWYSVPFAFIARLTGDVITKGTGALAPSLFYGIAYALIFAGSASLFRHAQGKSGAQSTRYLARFLVLSVALSMAAALAYGGLVWIFRTAPTSELAGKLLSRSVGDTIGILTVAPLLLMADRKDNILNLLRVNPLQLTGAAAGICAVAFVVFGLENTDEFKYFYVLFIPLIVLAMKYGLTGAAFGVIVSDLAMMAIVAQRDFSRTTAIELQILMASLAMTALILGSVVNERGRLSSELIKSHERLRDRELALIHASRLSLVSEMATALAHELNQPLSSVRNYVRAIQRLLERPKIDRKRVRHVIMQAVTQIDSASSLIQQTRRFLRRGEVPMERADLRQIIVTSLELLRPELRKTAITLRTEMPDYVPAVSANAIQIQQVLLNLLRNAKEAIIESDGFRREINIAVSTGRRPGFVEIAVSDTGGGIAPEARQNLFRPFFTSKQEGLGLGLALCSSIVSAHGGELWLDEQSASVTRFVFTLPYHQRQTPET